MTKFVPQERPDGLCGAAPRKDRTKPCELPAGWGTGHPGVGACKLHGGSTPNGIKNADKQIAERSVRSFGLTVVTTPTEALLGELYRTAGAVAWLDQIVQGLDHSEITRGVATIKLSGDARKEVTTTAAVNIWVDLWHRERSHLVAVAKACHDVRIDSARVELAQRQGELLGGVIDRLLVMLGDRLELELASAGFRERWGVIVGEVVPAALLEAATSEQDH